MENKYMAVNAAPQFNAAKMNQHAMVRQNMQSLAQYGAPPKPAPKPVKKTNTLKENAKKYLPFIVIAGVVGYKQIEAKKSTPVK